MATRNTGGDEGTRDTATGPMDGPARGSGSPPALKDQAAELGKKATRGARQAVTQAQSQAQSRLERGKQDAALTLTSVATTLLNSGMQLRDDEQPLAGEYVERAAKQIERAAHYVQSADLSEVVDQVEDFARKRPALFIGSAFAAGLLAARFLKSSRTTPRRADDESREDRLYTDREIPARVAMEPRLGEPRLGEPRLGEPRLGEPRLGETGQTASPPQSTPWQEPL